MKDRPQPSIPAKKGQSFGKRIGQRGGPLGWTLALSALIHLGGAIGVLSLLPQGSPDEAARRAGPIRVSNYPKGPTPSLMREGADPSKASTVSGLNKNQPILFSLSGPPKGPKGVEERPRVERTTSPPMAGQNPTLLLGASKEGLVPRAVLKFEKDLPSAKGPFPSPTLEEGQSSRKPDRSPSGSGRKEERAPLLFEVEAVEGALAGGPEAEVWGHLPVLYPEAERGPEGKGSGSLEDGTRGGGGSEGAPLRLLTEHQVLPRYPLIARREGLEGTTLLRVQIRPDGRVARVLLLQSSGHSSLDEAAVEALYLWRFRFEGEPPRGGVWASLPVRFELRRE